MIWVLFRFGDFGWWGCLCGFAFGDLGCVDWLCLVLIVIVLFDLVVYYGLVLFVDLISSCLVVYWLICGVFDVCFDFV